MRSGRHGGAVDVERAADLYAHAGACAGSVPSWAFIGARQAHYLIRAIPYQDPQQEAERLKKVRQARSRSSQSLSSSSVTEAEGHDHDVRVNTRVRRAVEAAGRAARG